MNIFCRNRVRFYMCEAICVFIKRKITLKQLGRLLKYRKRIDYIIQNISDKEGIDMKVYNILHKWECVRVAVIIYNKDNKVKIEKIRKKLLIDFCSIILGKNIDESEYIINKLRL